MTASRHRPVRSHGTPVRAAAGVSRRAFLKASGAALALSLARLSWRGEASARPGPSSETTPAVPGSYGDWRDVYREQWTWDRVARGTHYVNCAFQRGCAWNVYVKDGVVWREEQVADYPQTRPEVPDFSPRGCQKGACYSERMYDPTRVRYPLRRVGPRGRGRWVRVSWDEALTAICDKVIDVLAESGPDAVVWDLGSAVTNGCHALGLTRTVHVLDTPFLENNTEIGDHYPGATVTTGKICFTGSFDDLFYSDLILIWGGNPVYTHIPNAHFINEARYHGARVVTIAPDYGPSSIHSDEWIDVAMGTDAAFALAAAHVMIEENLYDRSFVVEQTDLPLLARREGGRLLRQSDIERGGHDDVFYVFDRATGRVVEAPRATLALNGIDPALDGEYRVRGSDGEIVVEPVMARLRRHLADYTPEKASRICRTHPERIRRFARMFARARAAAAITQTNFGKYYHGMEMERAVILVFALAGHIGRKGAGIAAFPYLSIDGAEPLSVASGKLPPKLAVAGLAVKSTPSILALKWDGYTNEMIFGELARREYRHGRMLATPLWLYRHGGLRELYGSARRWDPSLPRDFAEYFDDAVERGWQFVPKTPPRILFEVGGNMLRRVRGYDRMIDGLLPRLDLLVTLDWRMSNTARFSDYVLPAAGWYEKDDITWGSPITPFAHVTTRAVDPLGESKSDWQFHCTFLEALERRAAERGVLEYRDRRGHPRRLDRVYQEFSFGGRLRADNTEEVLEEVLSLTTNLGGTTWAELREKGYARYTGVGTNPSQVGHATDIEPDDTITANTWQVQKKQPWPTLTRRMQFCIDHPLFVELGEMLPVHKDNPKIGGDYPLQMTGGHDRWTIHASWRDAANLLRLQRGRPIVFLSAADARGRGIEDGDRVRVFNDVGSFEIQAKVAPGVRPGQVIVYHAWEPFQFRRGKSHQSAIPSPMNPVHLAGGYYQLQPTLLMGEPGCPDRGTRVEVERIERRRD